MEATDADPHFPGRVLDPERFGQVVGDKPLRKTNRLGHDSLATFCGCVIPQHTCEKPVQRGPRRNDRELIARPVLAV